MDANVGAMLDCARIGDALHEIHNSRHDPLFSIPGLGMRSMKFTIHDTTPF